MTLDTNASSTAPSLSAVEIEPTQTATASVIWMHGLGADGNDFRDVIPALNLPSTLAIRFIFPNAPKLAVTINNGLVMPAWYDILAMDIDRTIDTEQLTASSTLVGEFVSRELESGIASERIIIAGFSQGGAVAYELALSHPKRLGGLMAFSTYFATKETIKLSPTNQELPILIAHGTHDNVVPCILGEQANTLLKAKNYATEYKTYPMEHSLCIEQINDVSAWLQARLL
jgi:phospholipase/carboxylesterase